MKRKNDEIKIYKPKKSYTLKITRLKKINRNEFTLNNTMSIYN